MTQPKSYTNLAGPALLAVGLLIAWRRTFQEMWLRWYPAWAQKSLSLSDRLMQGDSYYNHGPMVILVSGVLVIFIFRRVGYPNHRNAGSTLLGSVLFIFMLALHLLCLYASVTFVSALALIGALAALLLWHGGGVSLRAYWVPIALLLFMVPMPLHLIAEFNYELKMFATESAAWTATALCGVASFVDGNSVFCAPGPDGEPRFLLIESACSGLRNLIALIWFGSLFAVTCRLRGKWRLLILACTIPTAILANVIRIAVLIVGLDSGWLRWIGPGTQLHDVIGLTTFALAIAMLVLVERCILAMHHWVGKDCFESRVMAFLDRIPRQPSPQPVPVFIPMILIVITAVSGFQLSTAQGSAIQPTRCMIDTLPTDLVVDDSTLTGRNAPLTNHDTLKLETADHYCRVYGDDTDNGKVTALVVYSASNRRSVHPPDVCLTGSGADIIHRADIELCIRSDKTVPMRELIVQDSDRIVVHWYVLRCGPTYTLDYTIHQAGIMLNSVLGRDSSGMLFHVSVPVLHNDIAGTRTLAKRAAEALIDHLDRHLPSPPEPR